MSTKQKLPSRPQRQAKTTGVKARELGMPHERDESINATAPDPDPLIAQAKRDLDAGQVDTDMRATPGLDAKKRDQLVPGAGGKRPGRQP